MLLRVKQIYQEKQIPLFRRSQRFLLMWLHLSLIDVKYNSHTTQGKMFFEGKYQILIWPHWILSSILWGVIYAGRMQSLLPAEVFPHHIAIHNSIIDLPTNFQHLPVFPFIHSYTLGWELPFLWNLGKTPSFSSGLPLCSKIPYTPCWLWSSA